MAGKLIETSKRAAEWDSDPLRQVHAGDTTTLPTAGSRGLANLSREEATTVLVFSPALADSTFFDQRQAGERAPRRTTPAVERRTDNGVNKVLRTRRRTNLTIVQSEIEG